MMSEAVHSHSSVQRSHSSGTIGRAQSRQPVVQRQNLFATNGFDGSASEGRNTRHSAEVAVAAGSRLRLTGMQSRQRQSEKNAPLRSSPRPQRHPHASAHELSVSSTSTIIRSTPTDLDALRRRHRLKQQKLALRDQRLSSAPVGTHLPGDSPQTASQRPHSFQAAKSVFERSPAPQTVSGTTGRNSPRRSSSARMGVAHGMVVCSPSLVDVKNAIFFNKHRGKIFKVVVADRVEARDPGAISTSVVANVDRVGALVQFQRGQGLVLRFHDGRHPTLLAIKAASSLERMQNLAPPSAKPTPLLFVRHRTDS